MLLAIEPRTLVLSLGKHADARSESSLSESRCSKTLREASLRLSAHRPAPDIAMRNVNTRHTNLWAMRIIRVNNDFALFWRLSHLVATQTSHVQLRYGAEDDPSDPFHALA